MGDYHVDRPGVEDEQSLELTGTNRPDTFYLNKSLVLSMNVLLCAVFRHDVASETRRRDGASFWRR